MTLAISVFVPGLQDAPHGALASPGRKELHMMSVTQAETLRKAIENLIDAKMMDAIARPGGIDRLLAHRRTGVASFDIRNAERKLQETLGDLLFSEKNVESQVA